MTKPLTEAKKALDEAIEAYEKAKHLVDEFPRLGSIYDLEAGTCIVEDRRQRYHQLLNDEDEK